MTKLCNGNRLALATLTATLMVSGLAFAQQATTSDPYSGMSQPPPDTTIVANPDAAAQPAAQTAPSQTAKPSPDVPAAAPATPPAATKALGLPWRSRNNFRPLRSRSATTSTMLCWNEAQRSRTSSSVRGAIRSASSQDFLKGRFIGCGTSGTIKYAPIKAWPPVNSRVDFQNTETRHVTKFRIALAARLVSGSDFLQARAKGGIGLFHVVANFPPLEGSNGRRRKRAPGAPRRGS